MIELATVPVAPDIKPTEAPPGPQQAEVQSQPEPQKPIEKTATLPPAPQQPEQVTPVEKTVELPVAPQAEPQPAVMLPPKPPEKRVEKKHRQKYASLASAPSTAENKAERAAAPTPGASSHNPNAVPNWKSQLVARLERYKRYPSEAQARGEQGAAQLAFSVDRSGGVHHARITRSSGSSLLDSATLAMLERAAPLPPPPPEISGAQVAISVPIRYNIR